MKSIIYVVAEHSQGRISPITYELIACAVANRRLYSAEIRLVIIGKAVQPLIDEIARKTDVDIIAFEVADLAMYNPEVYVELLSTRLPLLDFTLFCAAHSSQGMDFSASLAARIDGVSLSNIETIVEREGEIYYYRSIFGGKLSMEMKSDAKRLVLTIQPGAFDSQPATGQSRGEVERHIVDYAPRRVRSMGSKPSGEDHSDLENASVIVAAGRGIGDQEKLELIFQLATLFSKSAVAGSRPLCDLGWLSYWRQVGVTGATVSPELYVACGISGAFQHVSGMREAKWVVSINTDPNAAMFHLSDLRVVEDITTFIPILLEEYRELFLKTPTFSDYIAY